MKPSLTLTFLILAVVSLNSVLAQSPGFYEGTPAFKVANYVSRNLGSTIECPDGLQETVAQWGAVDYLCFDAERRFENKFDSYAEKNPQLFVNEGHWTKEEGIWIRFDQLSDGYNLVTLARSGFVILMGGN